MRARLNLASQPFRNEALPNLAFALGSLLALALTVQHALHLRGLLGETSSSLHQQVGSLESELLSLRREIRFVHAPLPENAQLAEWRVVQDLVDRRTFSWTLLFRRLESVLPVGIRLESITPSLASGQIHIELQAIARTREEGFDFARALQEQGSFRDVLPTSVDTFPRGEHFTYVMVYRPPEGRP